MEKKGWVGEGKIEKKMKKNIHTKCRFRSSALVRFASSTNCNLNRCKYNIRRKINLKTINAKVSIYIERQKLSRDIVPGRGVVPGHVFIK